MVAVLVPMARPKEIIAAVEVSIDVDIDSFHKQHQMILVLSCVEIPIKWTCEPRHVK